MAKKLWGGRFEKPTDPLVEKFTQSIQYDKKLANYDVFGSFLHVLVLEKSGYLSPPEASELKDVLRTIREDIKNGKFAPDDKYEDIHTYIQNILEDKLGDKAFKLRMARSRNDQVVFSTKVYCKVAMDELNDNINKLKSSIEELVKNNNDIIIPGFTHMQHAQPVYLKDYLGTYLEMFYRDANRLNYIANNMKITIGAGALAGTPIDSSEYKVNIEELLKEKDHLKNLKELLNIEPVSNSLDAVSDRDFVIEIISALSIVAIHLSRLSEDLIIWSTKEFDFIEIDEAFCTGSSLMPQKKNPDVLELVRGYTSRLIGNLVSVLTMMKGLPLTYNRDMQLDKEPLFNSFEIVSSEVEVLCGLIKTLIFNTDKIEEHLKDESLYATDLVYYLVKNKEIPFKEAHDIIGKLVSDSIDKQSLKGLFTNFLAERFPKEPINKKDINDLFDARHSVESKKSIKRE